MVTRSPIRPGYGSYSRFDRFHKNTVDSGTGVDEIMQILAGGGVRIMQRLTGDAFMTLHLNCLDENVGWLVTYNGGHPHIGSLSAAKVGTVLMQVIGPERWVMRYEGDE